MIIYNKTWLDNLNIQRNAEQQQATGAISIEELKIIKEKFPVGFYMPGVIVRIGLFILTVFIASASSAFIGLMLSDVGAVDSFGLPLFFGIACLTSLELLIREKKYFRSGVNDALLWIAGSFLTYAFWRLLLKNDDLPYQTQHNIELSLFVLILGTILVLRYADVFISAVTCLALFAFVFFIWQKTGPFGNATMPFIIIIAAAITYILTLRLSKKSGANYYDDCITSVKIVSLLVLYAAGNYLIVDELNKELNGAAATVSFKPFFWGWTMLLPLLYVIYGIFKKDTLFLRIGLLLIAGAVYTFKTYYHVISIELALILGGGVLFAIAYMIISYLKTPKHGFTYADLNHTDNLDTLKIESLITAATTKHVHDTPTKNSETFGGGDFGGGGSGGKF